MNLRANLRVVLPLLTLLWIGCGGPNDPARVAEVDAFIASNDSMVAHHKTMDATRFQERRTVFMGQRQGLEVFLTDTLDRERAFLVGNYYRAMSKNLDRLLQNHARMGEELELSSNKLRDLRSDMQRGLLDPELEKAYLEQERMALSELKRGMGVLDAGVELVDRIWNESHERIETLLNSDEKSGTE